MFSSIVSMHVQLSLLKSSMQVTEVICHDMLGAEPKSYNYIDVIFNSFHAPCTISSIPHTFAKQLLFVLLSLIGGGNRTVDEVL